MRVHMGHGLNVFFKDNEGGGAVCSKFTGPDIEKEKPDGEVNNICSRQSPHIYFPIRNIEHFN